MADSDSSEGINVIDVHYPPQNDREELDSDDEVSAEVEHHELNHEQQQSPPTQSSLPISMAGDVYKDINFKDKTQLRQWFPRTANLDKMVLLASLKVSVNVPHYFVGRCSKCQNIVKANKKSFLSNWFRHLTDVHRDDGMKQATLTSAAKYAASHTTQIAFNERLLRFIVMDGLALRTVESCWLKSVVELLNPLLTIPTRKSFVSKWLNMEFDKMAKGLLAELAAVKYVSCGIDLWTSRDMHSFAGITVHYVKDFTMQSKVIGFERLTGKNTAIAIKSIYDEVVKSFNIPATKIVRVLRDSGSNMVCAFPEDLSFLPHENEEEDEDEMEPRIAEGVEWEPDDINVWAAALETGAFMLVENDLDLACKEDGMRCVLHVWNRIIVNGLEIALKKKGSFYTAMKKVGKIVNASHKGNKCAEAVEEAFKKATKVAKKLKTRNDTRWLSDFDMVKRFLELHAIVDARWWDEFVKQTSSLTSGDVTFTNNESQSLKFYVTLLSPVSAAFQHFQSRTHATLGDVLPMWEHLIAECETQNDVRLPSDLKLFVEHWKTELIRQFPKDRDHLLMIAAIMHPGRRVEWLETAKYCKSKKTAALAAIRTRLSAQVDNVVVEEVKNNDGSIHAMLGSKKPKSGSRDDMLSKYLAMEDISLQDETDPLAFWKKQSEKPAWKGLVDVFLWSASVFPGTFVVESVFSMSGYIEGTRRTRLGSKTFRKLVMLKWNGCIKQNNSNK